jgi:hypothetical protein
MDGVLTFDDVDLPDDRVSLDLWHEQCALFPLGRPVAQTSVG